MNWLCSTYEMSWKQEPIQELQFLCSSPEIRATTATTHLN
jgi:hypothetical protein